MKPMKNKQTAVEWLYNHWKKLQLEGEKMSWQQIIDITELAKEMEKEQLFEFFKAGQDSMEEGGKSFHQIADKYLTINRI